MKLERRAFSAEVRADGETPRMAGHAAVFNTDTEICGWYTERILPGAFAETIASDDIRAIWNHNSDIVLGRNRANTLTLTEDDKGLYVEILPPASAEREIESVKRGDVSQMSFGFQVLDANWVVEDSKEIRVIGKVKLWEVSPCTFPAYEQTDLSVRSAAEVFESRNTTPKEPAPPSDAGQGELNSAAQPSEPQTDSLTVIRERFEFMHRNA
jgi:HK97 family phage prohead protease